MLRIELCPAALVCDLISEFLYPAGYRNAAPAPATSEELVFVTLYQLRCIEYIKCLPQVSFNSLTL